MFVTVQQIAALYAMRKASPVFDVREDRSGCRLIVTAPSGERWLVTEGGTAHKQDTEEGAV